VPFLEAANYETNPVLGLNNVCDQLIGIFMYIEIFSISQPFMISFSMLLLLFLLTYIALYNQTYEVKSEKSPTSERGSLEKTKIQDDDVSRASMVSPKWQQMERAYSKRASQVAKKSEVSTRKDETTKN